MQKEEEMENNESSIGEVGPEERHASMADHILSEEIYEEERIDVRAVNNIIKIKGNKKCARTLEIQAGKLKYLAAMILFCGERLWDSEQEFREDTAAALEQVRKEWIPKCKKLLQFIERDLEEDIETHREWCKSYEFVANPFRAIQIRAIDDKFFSDFIKWEKQQETRSGKKK